MVVAERLLKWQPDSRHHVLLAKSLLLAPLMSSSIRKVHCARYASLHSLEVHRIGCPAQVLGAVVAHKGQVSLEPACMAPKRGISCLLMELDIAPQQTQCQMAGKLARCLSTGYTIGLSD